MPTKQGDVGLLNDPVAQKMLHSTVPARFAYNWTDGTPRVVPIWFHWNGAEIVLCSPDHAPKLKSLQDGDAVAVTIDNDTMPYKVLLIRGTIHLDVVQGVAPEYEEAAIRVLGEAGGQGFLSQLRPICPSMTRVFITPSWVGVLDFETRFPAALERAMEQAGAGH